MLKSKDITLLTKVHTVKVMTDHYVHSKSVWPWLLGRELYQRSTTIEGPGRGIYPYLQNGHSLQWLRVCLPCWGPGFNPQVGKIHGRQEWQFTPVFLPGKSHRPRGACWITIQGVTQSRTRLSDFHLRFFSVVMYGCESWTIKKAEGQRVDAFKLWWWRRQEFLGLQGYQTSQFLRKSTLNIHWKD